MGEVTGIEWTDHSWSPWEGCQQIGPGCDNCYAMVLNRRWAAKGSAPEGGWAKGEAPNWGPRAPRRRASEASWAKVRGWDRAARKAGVRRTVFPSVCDPFDNAVDPAWRADFFDLIRATPNLVWLLLTKRIGVVERLLAAEGLDLPPNAALGATIVNQEEADRDVPTFLGAASRLKPAFTFLSVEPMLGPVDLDRLRPDATMSMNGLTGEGRHLLGFTARVPGVDWVICGGESGAGARPMHPDWARGLRDQCAAAGTAFLFKQWGEWLPAVQDDDGARAYMSPDDGGDDARFAGFGRRAVRHLGGGQSAWRVGKKAAGRLLAGVLHDARPAALTGEVV